MKKFLLKAGLAAVLVFAGTNLVKAQQFGDNLGNHKATKDLLMETKQILNASGVAIGTATLTNTSIALQIDGATKAILIPRVALNTDIVAPLNGMIIYNTTDNKFNLYQNGAWVTFALALKASTDGINATGNANGYTLTQVGQEMILKLSPATATTPGVVTIDPQTFAGEKTFDGNVIVSGSNTLTVGAGATPGATTLNGTLTVTGAETAEDDGTEAMLVILKTTGMVRKSAQSPVFFAKSLVAIPAGASAGFLAEGNSGIEVVLTVAGVKTDDAIVVNFSAANIASFAGLTILSAVATAADTVTVSIADLRNPAATGYAAPLLDGKSLVISKLR